MDSTQPPLDDVDYFTLSPAPSSSSHLSPSSIPSSSASPSPSPTSPSSKYLEFVPRVSSPLTSPPLSPHGDHDAHSNSHYSDVFAALVGMEGMWTDGRRRRRRLDVDGLDEGQREGEDVEDEQGRKRRLSSHIPHVHIERLLPWRRSTTHSILVSPPGESDDTPSDSDVDYPPPGIRQRGRQGRHPPHNVEDDSDSTEAEAMDLGAAMRRDLREKRYRRWDPARDEERRGGGVTLAQLLAEELAFSRALETLEEREDERERIERRVRGDEVEREAVVEKEKGHEVKEKVELVEGSGEECRSDDGNGIFEVTSDGGHGSAEGGSDESGTSGLSGSTDSSEETSHGHGLLLRPTTPVRPKRGRSKLRRRKPPLSCAHQRSRSEVVPSRVRDTSLHSDGEANVGCLPCSLGVRRSLRRLSFKLKLRRPEEISPALQALVERPMSPEEYHQYFLSLYLKEGSSSSETPETDHSRIRSGSSGELRETYRVGEGGGPIAGRSRVELGTDDSMREVPRGVEHIRASTR